uniref:Uncharacterized protein n=1 Tax=Anguilla anguilla TaxID=7936 RepID=A0A0E9PNU0_ANGAN
MKIQTHRGMTDGETSLQQTTLYYLLPRTDHTAYCSHSCLYPLTAYFSQ